MDNTTVVWTEFGGGSVLLSSIREFTTEGALVVAIMQDDSQVAMKAHDTAKLAEDAVTAILAAIEGGVEVIIIDDF